MIKGPVHQKNIAILNVHTLNRAAKCVNQKPDRTERRNRYIHDYS